MFKSWRNDKNKIKAVFKLQFQATQVPKLKKSALTISLVPDDVGKPTFKLEKAPVQDGTCSWENPIYVSVKLIKEPKTGKINEKIYHFVVATGSSKSGFLGEASLDFADFLAESEPLTVSLPLKFANSGAVLHVQIQKMQGANDPRDPTLLTEESFRSQQNNVGIGGRNQDLAQENGLETNKYLPNRQNSMAARKNWHKRSNTEWSMSSASDESFAVSKTSHDSNFQRLWADDSNDPNERLKNEIESLKRQADITELEIQSLRKQVTKESNTTQELSRVVSCLKEERDVLLEECEHLKLQKSKDEVEAESRLRSFSEDSSNMIEEIREELNCEKDLSNNLRLQLQRTQDSNSNLTLAVRDLNEMLERKNQEISLLIEELEAIKEVKSECEKNENKHDEELREMDMLKQTIENLRNELESCKESNEEIDMKLKTITQDYQSLKEENHNLYEKLEQQEHLQMKDEREELESQMQILEEKIKWQSLEYSESVTTINELETQVKVLKKDLEEQARVFEDDRDAMMHVKMEQEHRTIRAEENLRKTRWKNAIMAERLQEKCKRVSLEMESKLDENEKLTTKAVSEANELRLQTRNLEEMLEETKKELFKQKELSKQLEHDITHKEEKHQAMSMEIPMIKAEIEKLVKERDEANTSATETELLIHGWRKERVDLERKLAFVKEEAEKAQKQLIAISSSNEEKETMIQNLKREVETISLQYTELQNIFVQEKLENETLTKHISQLKLNIQRKEEDMSTCLSMRKEDGESDKVLNNSTSNTCKEDDVAKLLDELAFFKNRNSSMERELKEMEGRYSEVSLSFAEVEGERQQLVMALRNLKNGKNA